MSPEQRNTMVRGMVARLAERLKQDGTDVEGWLRLLRAYMVLGDKEQARAAAADARRALASDPDKLRSASTKLDQRVWGSKVMTNSSMTRKQRRLVLIGSSLGVLALAAALVLSALKDSIVFFNSPTDVVEKQVAARQPHPARRAGQARHACSAATISRCASR